MSQLIFPLQTTQPDYTVAANLIASQSDILSYVIQTLAQYVDATLSDQQQAIDAVTRVLQASARSRVAANGRRINPVLDCLGTCAAVAVAEDRIQAERAAASVGCPCPTGVSPTAGQTTATGLVSQPTGTLGTATPAIETTQSGSISRSVDSLGTATPAIVTDGVGQEPVQSPPGSLPPGCVLIAYVSDPRSLQYPSGRPIDDVAVNRSAALGYYTNPDRTTSYFSVPSADGYSIVPPSVLHGYYDIPAGYVPYSDIATGPPYYNCPAGNVIPPPPPPPSDAPTNYYCGVYANGTIQSFHVQGELTPDIRAKFVSVTGPYPDASTALRFCQGRIPEPIPPPTIDQEWYCVRSKNSVGETIYAALPFENQLAIQNTSWEYVSGPYVNQITAQAVCTATESGTASGYTCPEFTIPPLPQWCETNVCDTIDAIIAASQGSEGIDLFKLLGAGTLDSPGGSGTWLDKTKELVAVGDWLYTTITTVLCTVSRGINAALSSSGPNIPAYLVANGAVFLAGLGRHYFGDGFSDIQTRAGYFSDYMSPTLIPSVGEADAAFVRGFIDEKQWRCWVRANNVCDEPHKRILEAQFLRPSWSQAERLHRIGLIDEESLDSYYVHSGISNPGERAMFRELYTNFPGFDAVISFMVRDVFDASAVSAGRLDAEFDAKYTSDAERLGNIAGLSRDLAKLYWMAHWRQPSTTELFTMLHRLRPGYVPQEVVVTAADIERQLGVNDVAPAWRKKLMEISYHSVSIRQARQFFQNEVIDAKGVEDIYLNQGYIPAQAHLAAQNEIIVKRRALAQLFKGWTPAAIASAYAAGKITEQEVNARASYLGASKEQIDDLRNRARIDRAAKVNLRAESRAISTAWTTVLGAYRAGSVDRTTAIQILLQHGWAESSANIALDAEDVRARQQVVSQAVATTRRAFLSGEITAASVPTLLASIGVSQPRIAEYLTTWQLQLTPKRRTLSGQQALRLFSEALMDEPTVRSRLLNLGWSDPDLTLLVLEARNKRLAAEARAAAAAERERIQAAAQLAKEVAAQQKLLQQTQSKLCHMVSVSRLIKWYAHRWISQTYLITRLRYCGYAEDIVAGYIAEAENAREKVEAAEAKAEATAGSASGTTSGNGTVAG